MKTELRTVTPDMAAAMLLRNVSNRPLRRHTVEHYARQMREGAWQVTHQGIGLDAAGNLVDGQHRLNAVVLSGVAVQMLVTEYDRDTTALHMPLDIGLGRSYSDVLQIPRKHLEIIRLLHEVATGGHMHKKMTFSDVDKVHTHIVQYIAVMSPAILRSLCAHRVGTLLAALQRPDECRLIYEQSGWFAQGSNCTEWWPSVAAFNRTTTQHARAHWNGVAGRADYIIRWRMAMLNVNFRVIRITSYDGQLQEIREQCRQLLAAAGVVL